MGIYINAAGVAVSLVGGIFSTYQLYKLVKTDAACRGIKNPSLWGTLAASGNNQSGIILYLICRRRYPIISVTDEQRTFMKNSPWGWYSLLSEWLPASGERFFCNKKPVS